MVHVADAKDAGSVAAVSRAKTLAGAVNLARDLVNTPPNHLPPSVLAEAARAAVADLPVEVTVWDELDLIREGCGGILAVGQGSEAPPRLLRLAYRHPDATQHLALIGKGITFDTGGISIKPAAGMEAMKNDMGGAAAPLTPEQSASSLRQTLNRILEQRDPTQRGAFLNHDGQSLPW